jgi:hypothetical protein
LDDGNHAQHVRSGHSDDNQPIITVIALDGMVGGEGIEPPTSSV